VIVGNAGEADFEQAEATRITNRNITKRLIIVSLLSVMAVVEAQAGEYFHDQATLFYILRQYSMRSAKL
jgi:hypothetical protein